MNQVMDAETEFLAGMLELQYGEPAQEELQELQALAVKIPWAAGWPADAKAFWNAEAFMWQRKISRQTRELIARELSFLAGGRNLDLGCGAYSYLPSVGIDFADKMLWNNEQCSLKIVADLEKPLPLESQSFDSVTAVFVLNYVRHCGVLLREVRRVLKPDGTFMAILSARELNPWQRQKQVHDFTFAEWRRLLRKAGFGVVGYEKDALWFFRCQK